MFFTHINILFINSVFQGLIGYTVSGYNIDYIFPSVINPFFNSNRHPEKAIPFVPQNYCNTCNINFERLLHPKTIGKSQIFEKIFSVTKSSFYHPFSWFKRFCGKKNPLKCSIVKILDRYLVIVYRRKIQKIMTFFLTKIVI